jgi:hypothetical protein
VEQHVKLNGPHILQEHCVIEMSEDGEVAVFTAPGALAFVNGFNISDVLEPTPLCNGDRLILGSNHYFRFHVPAAAGGGSSSGSSSGSTNGRGGGGGGGSDTDTFDTDDDGESRHFTWEEAHAEVVGALQEALGDKGDVLTTTIMTVPPALGAAGTGISPGSAVVPAEELVRKKAAKRGTWTGRGRVRGRGRQIETKATVETLRELRQRKMAGQVFACQGSTLGAACVCSTCLRARVCLSVA